MPKNLNPNDTIPSRRRFGTFSVIDGGRSKDYK
jgi:hypothetical protein